MKLPVSAVSHCVTGMDPLFLDNEKEIQEIQEGITAERLRRFVGRSYDALVEEKVENEELAIARIYAQAPDVDGLTVIMGRGMESGSVVHVGITNVRGVDLEGVRI